MKTRARTYCKTRSCRSYFVGMFRVKNTNNQQREDTLFSRDYFSPVNLTSHTLWFKFEEAEFSVKSLLYRRFQNPCHVSTFLQFRCACPAIPEERVFFAWHYIEGRSTWRTPDQDNTILPRLGGWWAHDSHSTWWTMVSKQHATIPCSSACWPWMCLPGGIMRSTRNDCVNR